MALHLKNYVNRICSKTTDTPDLRGLTYYSSTVSFSWHLEQNQTFHAKAISLIHGRTSYYNLYKWLLLHAAVVSANEKAYVLGLTFSWANLSQRLPLLVQASFTTGVNSDFGSTATVLTHRKGCLINQLL